MNKDLVKKRRSSRSSLREIETKLSVLQKALSSLSEALSAVQSMKATETHLLFENLKSNFPKKGIVLRSAVKQYEVNLITQALQATNGNQTHAAKLLKLKITTLHAIIKRHNISF